MVDMLKSPYSTIFSLGFGPRMNKVVRFRELFELCRAYQGKPEDPRRVNPDWVGTPLPFYAPAMTVVQADIGQTVGIKVYSFSLMILERNKDTIYIEPQGSGSASLAVSYAYGPDDYRMVLSSMITNTDDGLTRRVEDLLVMPGTDDVEQVLSCYLTLCEMKKVDIRCIKMK